MDKRLRSINLSLHLLICGLRRCNSSHEPRSFGSAFFISFVFCILEMYVEEEILYPAKEQWFQCGIILLTSFVIGIAFTPKFGNLLDFFQFSGFVILCMTALYQLKLPFQVTIFNKHDKRIKEFITNIYFLIATVIFFHKLPWRCCNLFSLFFLAYFFVHISEPMHFRIAAALQCGWFVQIFEQNSPKRWSPRETRLKILDGFRSAFLLSWVVAVSVDVYGGVPRKCYFFTDQSILESEAAKGN